MYVVAMDYRGRKDTLYEQDIHENEKITILMYKYMYKYMRVCINICTNV